LSSGVKIGREPKAAIGIILSNLSELINL